MRFAGRFGVVVLVAVLCSAVASAEAPVAVSPGHADQLAQVESRCPTFNWGAMPGAKAYQLVVYRLGEEGSGEEAKPVVRATVPGSATGWTPALGQCLERGGRYAWAVRAVGKKETSKWSTPTLFEIAAPTKAQFEEALEVVRTYLAIQARTVPEAATAGEETSAEADAEPVAAGTPGTRAVGTTQLSVDGGVVAESFTGDGSTLTDLDAGELTSGTVLVERGGTGATTQEAARSNLGAAASGSNSDITALLGLTTPVAVSGGGTGATTATGALTNLSAVSQAELTTHTGTADAHREHDTLEESAEIDNDIATHAAFANVHHVLPTALPPSGPAGGDLSGSYPSPSVSDDSHGHGDASIDAAIARDAEVASLIAAEVHAERQCRGAGGSTDRYTDCGNGTIRDNNTGLIWLKDASCADLPGTDALGQADWPTAESAAAALGDGTCGLTDGSVAGDWRQPTIAEFCSAWSGSILVPCPSTAASNSLIDSSVGPPPVVNTQGDTVWMEGDAFVGVLSTNYWSDTPVSGNETAAWRVGLNNGAVTQQPKISDCYVWPVRDPSLACPDGLVQLGSGQCVDPATQPELDTHTGDPDAHREHATLEESAEIDTDIAAHAALTDIHHTPTVDTDTVLSEGQVETFVTNGPLDGSNFTNVTAVAGDSATDFFSTGQIGEPRIADEIARDSELASSEAAQTERLCDALSYRWIDLRDGTILDCGTGKQWLKDGDCLGTAVFDAVPSVISSLNSGSITTCTDYVAGTYSNWRAPDPGEYCSSWSGGTGPCSAAAADSSLIDVTVSGTPTVASGQGDVTWTQDDAFRDVQSARYWTSTFADVDLAWWADLSTGTVGLAFRVESYRVWAVRTPP